MHYAIKLNAPNDSSGNPRSVWMMWNDNGTFSGVQDVNPYGNNVQKPRGYPDCIVLHNNIPTTAKYYNQVVELTD